MVIYCLFIPNEQFNINEISALDVHLGTNFA